MNVNRDKKRLVVGISGASGALIGIRILEVLRHEEAWESHLVISNGGKQTIACETDYSLKEVVELADVFHETENIGASIASGTYPCEGMVIAPCSMKTLAGIASGYSDNLLLRAADVQLKERRQLVLIAREAPLSTIHLRNMLSLADMGAVILPPVLSLYNGPETIEDAVDHIVGKSLNIFGIDHTRFRRWGQE